VGLVPVASFTITKLRYVARVEPQNAAKIAAVCLPHDWLSWRIAGYGPKSQALDPDLDAIWTDRSDASGTGYFNSVTNEYDLDLVKLALGRSNIILPRVLRPNEVGAVASSKVAGSQVGAGAGGSGAAGSPSAGCAGAIVGAGGGDNAMAAFGLELEVGDVSVSLGTSGVVAVVANKQSNDASGLIAGFADCTGNFLPLVCTLNASRVLDAIKAVLGLGYDELSEQALSAEIGAGGITLVPYFEGERTPNRPNSNATIFGLTLENSLPSNFARAAVEGMLLSLRFGMDSFKAQGILPRKITLVGGGSKLVAVQQLISDVFGIAVYIPADGQYVADGAARQAAWALATLRGEEATGEARSDAPSGGEGGSGGSGVGAAGSASSSSASVPPPHWDIRAGKTFTPNINAAEKYHALAARYNTLAAQDSAGEIGV
jgi:xylulokinase